MAMSKPYTFYDQQIEMADRILSAFTSGEGELYGILLAQMQSGKSGTYYRLALEAVHRRFFDSVYIICGSRDTALRDQTKSGLLTALDTFCDEKDLRHSEGKRLENSIKVYWNQELKGVTISDKCLIINDESHTAQSKTNIPFKEFWKKNGLSTCLHGDFSVLRERDVRVLSVSATSFSECVENQRVSLGIDNLPTLNRKNVFIMDPGPTYTGVADFLRHERILFTSEPISEKTGGDHLCTVLLDEKYARKYCLVRTARATLDTALVQSIADRAGVIYKPVHGEKIKDTLSFLSEKPRHTTLVHICGIARMGQELDKTHIGFVYEQSHSPQIDTILQGLLGRVCGHNANIEVDIFISAKREKEVRQYARAVNLSDAECMASFAKIRPALNVKSGGGGKHTYGHTVQDLSGNLWDKMVPIKFDKTLMEKGFSGEYSFGHSDLHNLFTDHPELLRGNPDAKFIMQELTNPKYKSPQVRNLDARTYTDRKLTDSLDEACRTGARDTNQFTNVVCEHQTSGVVPFTVLRSTTTTNNTVYFIGYTPSTMSKTTWNSIRQMNTTQKKCNYNSHVVTTESGQEIQNVNGGQMVVFPKDTSENDVVFYDELKKAVQRSKENPLIQREITSLWCDGSKEFKGIRLSKTTFTQEKIDSITKKINEELSIKLKFIKTRGRQPSNWFQYSSIRW